MKRILFTLAAILSLLSVPIARSADWSTSFGIGASADDWLFSGSGVPTAVVQSVTSNLYWFAVSAKDSGQPVVERVIFKSDTLSSALDWYVATNSWVCASNQPAGTNIVWLTTTNSMMATNDICLLRNLASDSYQLVTISGNATDGTGLVYTNSSDYVGVKIFQTPTNVITANDILYKMAKVQTINPLQINSQTNQVNPVMTNLSPCNQWMEFNLGNAGFPKRYIGRLGYPGLLTLTYSNAAGIQVEGSYFVRQRR